MSLMEDVFLTAYLKLKPEDFKPKLTQKMIDEYFGDNRVGIVWYSKVIEGTEYPLSIAIEKDILKTSAKINEVENCEGFKGWIIK